MRKRHIQHTYKADKTRDPSNSHRTLPERVPTARLSSRLAHSSRSSWAVVSDKFTISGCQPLRADQPKPYSISLLTTVFRSYLPVESTPQVLL